MDPPTPCQKVQNAPRLAPKQKKRGKQHPRFFGRIFEAPQICHIARPGRKNSISPSCEKTPISGVSFGGLEEFRYLGGRVYCLSYPIPSPLVRFKKRKRNAFLFLSFFGVVSFPPILQLVVWSRIGGLGPPSKGCRLVKGTSGNGPYPIWVLSAHQLVVCSRIGGLVVKAG